MAEIKIEKLVKAFGDLVVLNNVDLDISDGEFVVFVGRSGCGKSTLLRSIAGLETISSGAIQIGGQDVTRLAPSKRGIAMVFQSYALYPHMSVRENMAFSLRLAGASASEKTRLVDNAAKILQLTEYLDRKPANLSGGQRQRVAIGRAIVRQPGVFLFDEPLSNLDADLRVQMRAELIQLHAKLGATMVYVTHDQVEAMTMADRIVVLNEGIIEQVGSPAELYSAPKNEFVASFIGSPKMNFIDVTASSEGSALTLSGGRKFEIQRPSGKLPPAKLGVRPEHVSFVPTGDAALSGKVRIVEALGSDSFVSVQCDDGKVLTVRVPGTSKLFVGDEVGMGFRAEAAHLFDGEGLRL